MDLVPTRSHALRQSLNTNGRTPASRVWASRDHGDVRGEILHLARFRYSTDAAIGSGYTGRAQAR